jgi:hypothetical protein
MTLPTVIGERLVTRRLPMLLMTAFGALALVLASVGVHARNVVSRERESGVRMAPGSRPAAVATVVAASRFALRVPRDLRVFRVPGCSQELDRQDDGRKISIVRFPRVDGSPKGAQHRRGDEDDCNRKL